MTQTAPEPHTVPAPLTLSADHPGFRPTLFLGLGGTAARVLRQLRRRLSQRFGDPALRPSLRILALDTDSAALRAAESGNPHDSLTPQETLHLPLRKPADYRSASDELLSWLSRRWLYNIPRSLHTEGLRPLGRLAFIDHRQTIAQRIQSALAEAVAGEAVERSSQTIKLGVRNRSPRVFVVASIGGGSGGGMLLDVAYAVRQQLDELRLAADVCGVMLHATFARSPANDLRKANAYATLTELNHFMQGGATYRTGPMEVLPAGDVSEPPFADAYLVDLGDDLSETAFEAAIAGVAQYLYLDAATCGAALDSYRQFGRSSQAAGHEPPRLRSFGLHAVRFDKHTIAAEEAERLALRVVQRWLRDPTNEQAPTARLQPPGFQLDDLASRLQSIADKALSGSAEAHFRTLVAAGSGGPAIMRDDDPAGPFGDELRRIHAVFGLPAALEAAHAASLPRFESTLRDGSRNLAAGIGSSLIDSISAFVEQPQGRLPLALAATSLFQAHLHELRQVAEQAFRHDQDEATALWSKLLRGALPRQRTSWFSRLGAAGNDPEEFLLDYCRLRLRTMIHKYLTALLQEVSANIAALNDRLIKLRQSLARLADELAAAVAKREGSQSAEPSESFLAGELEKFAGPDFVEQFDRTLQEEWLGAQGGLLTFADKASDDWRKLREELHERARGKVLGSLDAVDAASPLFKANPTIEKLKLAVAEVAERATPRLRPAGGAERLLVVTPRGPKTDVLVDAIRQGLPDVSLVLSSEDSDLVFCREAEGISLAEAAAALVEDRSDCAEAARRVLTRVDVPWASLAAE